MKKKSSYMLGVIIMAVGILLLLGQLGINVGWIIALIIPIYIVYKGWNLFTSSESSFKKGIGIALIAIGLLWFTGMIPVIIGLAIASFLIYYGMKMIKNHKSLLASPEIVMSDSCAKKKFYSDIKFDMHDELDEWEKEINNKK